MKVSTRDMILAAFFAAITVIGAKVNFLLPDIPITLQPIIVMLAGSLLGKNTASLSQIVYVIIGLIGIPVFAKPIAGPAYLLQPSFGYLIGFIAGAYIIGLIIEKASCKKITTFIIANLVGLLVIYIFGVLYMYILINIFLGKNITFIKALGTGMMQIFFIKDIILGVLVSFVSQNIYIKLERHI